MFKVQFWTIENVLIEIEKHCSSLHVELQLNLCYMILHLESSAIDLLINFFSTLNVLQFSPISNKCLIIQRDTSRAFVGRIKRVPV